jgi:hypothetical protein
MLIARLQIDGPPSLLELVITPHAVIGAALICAMISSGWFAALMYTRRKGTQQKLPLTLKYFFVATAALALLAAPMTCSVPTH